MDDREQRAHTLGFAATAGAIAGLAGLITTRRTGEQRNPARDALAGAAVCASHVVLDEIWFPYPPLRWSRRLPRVAGAPLGNWLADLLIYGAIAWRFRTR